MVEKLESVVTWRWAGPVAIGIIMTLIAAWAVNTNQRIMKLEDVVVSIDKQNVVQQGQYELILTRLNIMSQRLETLVQQHVYQGMDARPPRQGNQYNFSR